MRTQQEIIERFNEVSDIFNTQKHDLINYLTFENAKPFLDEEYIKSVESGEIEWTLFDNPKSEILEYLDFAYDKTLNQRGVSVGRSMLHFKTWIWLDNLNFYDKIKSKLENWDNYGISTLNEISEHYSFDNSKYIN